MPWDSIDKNTFTTDLESPDSKYYLLHGSMTPFYEIVPFNTVHYAFWRVIQSIRMQLVVAYTVVNPQVCIVFFFCKEDLLTYTFLQRYATKRYTYNYEK